jgi:membrane associated rhomboid family serine protease
MVLGVYFVGAGSSKAESTREDFRRHVVRGRWPGGERLDRATGSSRFATIYFAGGFAGAVLHLVVDATSTVPLIGCSGALFAVLAVAATLFGPAMLAFVVVFAAADRSRSFSARRLARFSSVSSCPVSGAVHLRYWLTLRG